jgi:hypothetical protein
VSGIATSAPGLEPLLAELALRRGPRGGFRARADDPAELEIVDATAWAAVALAIADPGSAARRGASDFLAGTQAPDGRLSVHPLHPGTYAPTSVAILAWSGDTARAAERRKAVDFLLTHEGLTYPQDSSSPNRIDTELRGWPWVDRTFSWAEPTALALLALAAAGEGAHARSREGVKVLLDRQIANGGWNYGNSRVFDADLLSAPESTGLVLAALAGAVERSQIELSLARLAEELPRLRTPLALAWSLLAAAAWRLDVGAGERARAIDETFARAPRYGGYETADVALLAIALAAPHGLLAALAPQPRRA